MEIVAIQSSREELRFGACSGNTQANNPLQQINITKLCNYFQRMYCMPQDQAFQGVPNCFFYYYQPSYQSYSNIFTPPLLPAEPSVTLPTIVDNFLVTESSLSSQKRLSLVTSRPTAEDIDFLSQNKILVKKSSSFIRTESSNHESRANRQIKLDFRIQWKNQNRNIVPNLVNQMISYLLKKSKSQKLIRRLIEYLPHDPSWTERKFYLYMKKIKESVTHYVNQNVILRFLEIHEPKCELYSYQEQLFYMRLCRIALMKFLQSDSVLICLTSNRMSEAKRMIHLIAREALLKKFVELCREAKY